MENTIDIGKLINLIWRRKKFIALMFAVCLLLSVIISAAFIKPSYKTGFTAYIGNRAADETTLSVTNADTNAAQALVYTYAEIIKSENFVEEALDNAGLTYSPDEIRKGMSISIKPETQLMEVNISSHSSQTCKEAADAIADLAPSYASDIVDGTSMRVISYPTEVTKPYSPNIKKNGFAGGCIGIVLAVAVICLTTLFDTKVGDARDLEYKYDVPLLGVIPEFRKEV